MNGMTNENAILYSSGRRYADRAALRAAGGEGSAAALRRVAADLGK